MAQDVRKMVDSILSRWGWDIYLQRRTNRSADVPEYKKNIVERHTVRSSFPGQGSGMPGITNETIAGLAHDVDLVFYFRWDANPEEGDLIYDIPHPNDSPDDETLDRVYEIDWAVPMRALGGELAFWTVGTTRTKG